ncbi:MAG TPA: hypothetical protein VH165_21825 [Kofleriaceae bacterium]|jgi:hypothetical protein|nr:hypothetical protein [Kofleriaceae bacterium]
MRVPVWLTLGIALLVCGFGLYRIRLAFRADATGTGAGTGAGDDAARPRRGLYAMRRRTHFLIGVVYLLLGGALIATSYGWSPVGNLFGPPTTTPTRDTAPAKPGSVPVDQLPPTK